MSNQLLTEWWLGHAAMEVEQTVAKMEEYGSGDLVEVGRQMAKMCDSDRTVLSPVDAMELGIAFYVLGKVARITSAIERGDRPSNDTWFDLSVYAKMVLAARAGAWEV